MEPQKPREEGFKKVGIGEVGTCVCVCLHLCVCVYVGVVIVATS